MIGRPIAALLQPEDDDYFVLKPKHSGFFSTQLEILLKYLGAETLILTGFAGNLCVLYTANDAYMRDFKLIVPRDCIASETAAADRQTLEHMRRWLKADTRPSAKIRLPGTLISYAGRGAGVNPIASAPLLPLTKKSTRHHLPPSQK